MKKLTLAVTLLMGVAFHAYAAAEPPMSIGHMRPETVKEQLFFVTVRIETVKGDQKKVGTGFILEYRPVGASSTEKFIVTNKHLIEGATSGNFFFIRSDGKNPQLGKKYDFYFDHFDKYWFKNPDPAIDVAIMPLDPILEELHKRDWKIYYRSVDERLIPSPEELKSLDAIEEVIFIGYPSAIFDETNYLPIARRGSSATPISVNYDGKPCFLIDASVFPGSSGSPVFIADTGASFQKDKGLVLKNRVYFLGIVSATGSREERSRFEIDGQATNAAINTSQSLNLGMVMKTESIYDTIYSYYKDRRSANS
jgi:hypothetical protein